MHRSFGRIGAVLVSLVLCGGCAPPNSDGDCLTDAEEQDHGTDPESSDTDGDGIGDCEEIQQGLDPTAADSDGDGFADSEEIDCVSDPLDGDEVCYACGWEHNDPGTYESDGNEVGDTADNSVIVDQCGEPVDLWDLTGKYYIVYLTAAW